MIVTHFKNFAYYKVDMNTFDCDCHFEKILIASVLLAISLSKPAPKPKIKEEKCTPKCDYSKYYRRGYNCENKRYDT